MTDSNVQDTTLKNHAARQKLSIGETLRRRSSGVLIPLTSTRTSGFRKIWPSTPSKIQKPTSESLLFQRALAELTLEEEERKAANARVVENNAEIEVTSFNCSTGVDGSTWLTEGRVRRNAEMNELLSRTYHEFRQPVDIEQGNFALKPKQKKGRATCLLPYYHKQTWPANQLYPS